MYTTPLRNEVRAAIAKAETTEQTVSLPYHYERESELLANAERSDAWTGFDGREYRAFIGPNESWRVVLVGPAYVQAARHR